MTGNRAGGAAKVAGSLRGTLKASWNLAAAFVRAARGADQYSLARRWVRTWRGATGWRWADA
jgi:hypothetical protein